MKKSLLLFSALLLLFNCNLKAQNTAPPLPQRTVTLTQLLDLNFGDVCIDPTQSGSISITSNNDVLPDNVIPLQIYSIRHRAELSFQLCPGRSIIITWTPGWFNMYSDGGGAMLLAQINSVRVNNQTMTNGQSFLSNKGCSDMHLIYIGGTLNFQSNGGYAGSYQGNFDITVNYQ